MPRDGYPLPDDLARHVPKKGFGPEELREACRSAGEGLGAEDARPGYLNGYDRTLASMEGSWDEIVRAARARWGVRWERKLEAAHGRTSAVD